MHPGAGAELRLRLLSIYHRLEEILSIKIIVAEEVFELILTPFPQTYELKHFSSMSSPVSDELYVYKGYKTKDKF